MSHDLWTDPSQGRGIANVPLSLPRHCKSLPSPAVTLLCLCLAEKTVCVQFQPWALIYRTELLPEMDQAYRVQLLKYAEPFSGVLYHLKPICLWLTILKLVQY